jgi:uncharacterized protein YegP (UPF0339 family)
VRSLLVVLADEMVEQCLELVEGGGWWVGGEPFLEGLVEAFDFAARGRVVRSRVLLGDVERVEQGLEAVASAAAGNGEIIASGESYVTKDGAKGGIASVKSNANAPTEDLT